MFCFTWLNDICDFDPLCVGHEAEDREDDDRRVEGGEGVHRAYHERVPEVAVAVEVVVVVGQLEEKRVINTKVMENNSHF